MAKKKDKSELVTKEETRPNTYFDEMERNVERFFRHPFSFMTPSTLLRDFPKLGDLSPSVDIYEEEKDMVVKADLPGITREDLNVSITENTLTITGEKKQEEKIEKNDYHRLERSYGSFRRTFRLPDNVSPDKAKASFKDGVLEVRLPKTKETKQKKINIT